MAQRGPGASRRAAGRRGASAASTSPKFLVEKGEHYVGVKCYGGWGPPGMAIPNRKRVMLEAGKRYYFLARAGGACGVIEQITEDDGKQRIAESTFVSAQQ